MQHAVEEIANRVVAKYRDTPKDERIVVGVAGIPGAGKTTIAFPLTELINEKLGLYTNEHVDVDADTGLASRPRTQDDQVAISVSLDGWHTLRSELDKMPDPAEARRRRGAAFTFDAQDYVDFVKALKQKPLTAEGVAYRTFSHSKKDYEIASSRILPRHRIVVIEGLYTLLNSEPWKRATDILDEKVWVDVDVNVARERLVGRHVRTGVESTEEAARARVDGSDMVNGRFIIDHLAEPTYTVKGIIDEVYAKAIGAKLAEGS